ncbi:MAG: VWA domain-containing protein [Pirellulales bacterium]|nr:VWA domain-containing protein [Pirellulales bacterium]
MIQFVKLSMVVGILGFLAAVPSVAWGQGVLVNANSDEAVRLPRPRIWLPYPPHPRPEPPTVTYKIKSLEISAKLQQQIAKVQVSQSFVNTGSRQMEVEFVFPLPYDGAIDQLTLLVDGKEFPARLFDAKAARTMYEEIVRSNKDPALLEWMGTGLFKTSVFPVPPGAERKVTLRFSQLCRNWDGLTDFIFPLSTAKYTSHPIEEVKFLLAIESDTAIKNIYSPSHSADIKRRDDKHAIVSYIAKNIVPADDFRLFYDVGKDAVGTKVLSYRPDSDEQGYFMLLASPQFKAADDVRPKKTIVLVVDRSGSMSGEKIEQAKGAAKFVINSLNDGDLFNLIAYDTDIECWRPELEKFNDENRKAALDFVEGLYPGGGTNINGALTTALQQLRETGQPNFVIFLTDGLPTIGETSEAKIVAAAREHNKVRARIFDFGVGYDVNSRLLDKLARENFGLSEYVRPNEDIERAVAALYHRIGSPVMTDVTIRLMLEGLQPTETINRVYPRNVVDLFAGEQVIVVGRYKRGGKGSIVIAGKVGEKEQEFTFPAELVENSNDGSNSFIEKLWAMRRVGQILDEIDLRGKNDELVKELVSLTLRHGILTPYTSFIADETGRARGMQEQAAAASSGLDRLSVVDGQFGVEQRRFKSNFQYAERAPAASPILAENGFGGGRKAAEESRRSLGSLFGSLDESKGVTQKAEENMRYVGGKVFYRRDNRWVDSKLPADEKQLKMKPIQIKRFSKEYFELVDTRGREVARFLAMDESVTVELGGKIYEID